MAEADSEVPTHEAKVRPIKDPVERTTAALEGQAGLEREIALRRGLEEELRRERDKRLQLEEELQRVTQMVDALQAKAALREERRNRRRGVFRRG